MLAADVVAVGFGDRADGHLAHLRAAAHDDDALAVDLFQSLDHLDAAHDGQFAQIVHQRVRLAGQRDFEVRAGAVLRIVENLNRTNIAAVLGDHPGQLV